MTFKLSGNMLRFCRFEEEVEVTGTTLTAGLRALVSLHPPLKDVLLDASGQLRPMHRIFVNGEMLDRTAMERAMAQNDEVAVLTAIAGG